MTFGEREVLNIVMAAFRDSAANGGFTCASELFGEDPGNELSEKYIIDSGSVPTSGPVSVVIYDIDAEEAFEVEVNFAVRDVSSQPHYERMFASKRTAILSKREIE